MLPLKALKLWLPFITNYNICTRNLISLDLANLHSHILETGKNKIHKGTSHLVLKNSTM